jgi:hypothetical protein
MTKPLFWTVTGEDFGRSIAWAKKQPNLINLHIKEALKKLQHDKPETPSHPHL